LGKTDVVPQLIALHMPGGSRFVDELKRAWDDGDAVLPVDTRLPAESVSLLLKSMGAAYLVDAEGIRHELADALPAEPGDALVVATSGSTGEPKGVVLTHEAVTASASLTSTRLGVTNNDHWLACLPLSHIGGLSVITRALHIGSQLTVHPEFNVDAVMTAARNGANYVSLVPTALQRIDATVFKTVLLGGSAPPSERPANAVITYGSTETGSGIVYDCEPLDGVELMLDQNGQLLIKSPTLLRCYRDGTDPRTPNGWYPSGDAASFDADKSLHVHGRMTEVINSGGEKVWPVAVEQALKTHASINEALVYGETESEWGQIVVARIELKAGAEPPTLEAVREHVKQTLPPYYAPKRANVVERLARTSNGKVDRRESARN
jgi:o-succinylbenzoate---CoA ligase